MRNMVMRLASAFCRCSGPADINADSKRDEQRDPDFSGQIHHDFNPLVDRTAP
jgi:hypothetical protein